MCIIPAHSELQKCEQVGCEDISTKSKRRLLKSTSKATILSFFDKKNCEVFELIVFFLP